MTEREIISDADIREVHALLMEDAEISIQEVATKLEVTAAALYYRFDALGLDPPIRARTADRDKEIRRLSKEGKDVRYLSEKFGLSKPSIYSIRRKKNGTRKKE